MKAGNVREGLDVLCSLDHAHKRSEAVGEVRSAVVAQRPHKHNLSDLYCVQTNMATTETYEHTHARTRHGGKCK